jgi:hypothetical protein
VAVYSAVITCDMRVNFGDSTLHIVCPRVCMTRILDDSENLFKGGFLRADYVCSVHAARIRLRTSLPIST